MLFKWYLILGLLASQSSWARFLGDDEIRADLSRPVISNINEAEFNGLVKMLQTVYSPVVSKFGGRLSIQGEWKNETPNAYANQLFGSWSVKVTGGLARRPELTYDGLTLIICHELGHHLGGFPLATNKPPFGGYWAANEGQSDYYATHACAKKVWGPESSKNAEFREKVDSYAKGACDMVWSESVDRDLCYRTTVAVESVSATMAALKSVPMTRFNTPDPAVVDRISMEHPAVQCRMDTSFQGALCGIPAREDMIPGKGVSNTPNSPEAEAAAAQVSCMKVNRAPMGLRPNCWFKER